MNKTKHLVTWFLYSMVPSNLILPADAAKSKKLLFHLPSKCSTWLQKPHNHAVALSLSWTRNLPGLMPWLLVRTPRSPPSQWRMYKPLNLWLGCFFDRASKIRPHIELLQTHSVVVIRLVVWRMHQRKAFMTDLCNWTSSRLGSVYADWTRCRTEYCWLYQPIVFGGCCYDTTKCYWDTSLTISNLA